MSTRKDWQLAAIVHGAMAVVVKGKVKPLPIRADKAVRIVQTALGPVAALCLKDAFVGPGL